MTCKDCNHERVCIYRTGEPNEAICPMFEEKLLRCKDCMYFKKRDEHGYDYDWCVMWTELGGCAEQVLEDGYCNFGERRATDAEHTETGHC